MKKVNKIIGIICLVLLLASVTLYFVTGAKWTEITMLIALGLAGVFNLFGKKRNDKKKKQEDDKNASDNDNTKNSSGLSE